MDRLTSTDYLKGVVENDFSILQKIYKDSLPEVVKYIRRNSGNLDDAKDVFQEGIVVIYQKALKKELELTTSFHNYLFSVCKRIWLKKLKRSGRKEVPFEDIEVSSNETELEAALFKRQKWVLFNRWFKELSEDCQKVLKMTFNGYSSKEIALTLDYTEDYAKRKRYKCRMSLTDFVRKDPEFKTLMG